MTQRALRPNRTAHCTSSASTAAGTAPSRIRLVSSSRMPVRMELTVTASADQCAERGRAHIDHRRCSDASKHGARGGAAARRIAVWRPVAIPAPRQTRVGRAEYRPSRVSVPQISAARCTETAPRWQAHSRCRARESGTPTTPTPAMFAKYRRSQTPLARRPDDRTQRYPAAPQPAPPSPSEMPTIARCSRVRCQMRAEP